jgi:hypothetical protein
MKQAKMMKLSPATLAVPGVAEYLINSDALAHMAKHGVRT